MSATATLSSLAIALATTGTAAAAEQVADGVFLIPGGFEAGRQPDGNSVLFVGGDGLVVVDSGRHSAHQAKIVAFATERKLPIVALVNTHWHLDHTGGNAELRRAFPSLEIHASRAVDGALSGFLADGRAQMTAALAKPGIDPVVADEMRTDLAAIDEPNALRPDVPVEASSMVRLGGRELSMRLAKHAATEGDVWLLDPKTRVVVAGDLVTLPAPFLDTACVEGWQRALGEIAKVEFTRLVPGHGEPMTTADFGRYRRSFDRLIGCAASDAEASRCADGWLADIGSLIAEGDRKLGRSLVEYYIVNILRAAPERRSRYCQKPA